MKNIHILPTDKPSRLQLSETGKFYLIDEIGHYGTSKSNHIYITSDEEIKEGDKDFYIIANDRDKTWINHIEKVIECKIDPKHGKVLILSSGFIYIDEGCKIILTTDPELIKDGVQTIDDEFLEWFVENPSCESVEVESGLYFYAEGEDRRYKIIIPKEEPKIDSIFNEANVRFSETLDKLSDNSLKQETLEEAAKEYERIHGNFKQNFIAGAKRNY